MFLLAIGLVMFGAVFFGGAFISGLSRRRHADSARRNE
jgi:hypothetical protein